MGFTWITSPTAAFVPMVENYATYIHQVVYLVCQARAPEIENWMKEYAPWQDRTGNARQTLHVQVFDRLQEVLVLLAHGMDYGISLELDHAGAYAILAPAVDHWTPILMQDIQRRLR